MGIFRSITALSMGALVLVSSGCTSQRSAFTYRRPYVPPYTVPPYSYYRAPGQYGPPSFQGPPEPQEQLSPRAAASLQLTHQARALLEQGKPDDAISVLERAVGLDSTNGQNYYYLAEAWISKGNSMQAEEFNRLASLYLNHDSIWMVYVAGQRARIDRMPR